MMNKRWSVFVCAAVCLALCCGCGREEGVLLVGASRQESGSQAEPERQDQEEARQEEALIRVYVCGAVAEPGVVEIPEGSRAEDALAAAGGFAGEAAPEAVNLADWVTDGQMLYFPTKEEAEELAQQKAPGLVNINTADAAQLCTLPGIGESRAADIVAYREKNGPFESCEDIMKVPGIKTSAYEKIRDKITVR